jgi:RNA polymerase sigma-70 factor, ECF subfamily
VSSDANRNARIYELRLGNESSAPVQELSSSLHQKAQDEQVSTFEQYRPLLFAIAYRMLGSVADAEDLLQDAFIRWQQAHLDEIESPRAFLVTVLKRLCINHLQAARLKHETYVGQWLPEPIVTGPVHNPLSALGTSESLSFAFLLLLERLTPSERAVLILRDVFDFEYSEIAAVLGRNQASCRQILKRARQHIKEGRARFDATREEQQDLLRRWSAASSRGDMDELIALLSKDAVFYSDGGGKGPALPKPLYGPTNIARGVLEGLRKLVPQKAFVRRPALINGTPGIVSFVDERPFSVIILDVSGGRICCIYVVSNPEKLMRLPSLTALSL